MRGASWPGIHYQEVHVLRERHVSPAALPLCRGVVQYSDAYRRHPWFHSIAKAVRRAIGRDRDEFSRGQRSRYTPHPTGRCSSYLIQEIYSRVQYLIDNEF